MELFGVENIEALKEAVGKCEFSLEMHYNRSFDSDPAVLNYIQVDDIGTLN